MAASPALGRGCAGMDNEGGSRVSADEKAGDDPSTSGVSTGGGVLDDAGSFFMGRLIKAHPGAKGQQNLNLYFCMNLAATHDSRAAMGKPRKIPLAW